MARAVGGELGQQTVRARQREVAEFAGGFGAAAAEEEFVVRPEGPVDEGGVGARSDFGPFAGTSGHTGRDENLLAVLFEEKSDRRLIGWGCAQEIVTGIVRIRPPRATVL